MVRKGTLWIMAAAVLFVCACDDPIIGEWKTSKRIDCDRRGEMEIQADLDGKGEIPIGCDLTCKISVAVRETDLGYDLKIKINTPEVCEVEGGDTKGTYECELEEDDTRLDCGNFYAWKRK